MIGLLLKFLEKKIKNAKKQITYFVWIVLIVYIKYPKIFKNVLKKTKSQKGRFLSRVLPVKWPEVTTNVFVIEVDWRIAMYHRLNYQRSIFKYFFKSVVGKFASLKSF